MIGVVTTSRKVPTSYCFKARGLLPWGKPLTQLNIMWNFLIAERNHK